MRRVLPPLIVLSLGFAPAPTRVRPEQDAIAALKRLGAKIEYAPAASGRYVRVVDFADTKVGDSDLKLLCRFTRLEEVRLIGTTISDAGLDHLRGIPTLQSICFQIDGERITNAGHRRLENALPKAFIIRVVAE